MQVDLGVDTKEESVADGSEVAKVVVRGAVVRGEGEMGEEV